MGTNIHGPSSNDRFAQRTASQIANRGRHAAERPSQSRSHQRRTRPRPSKSQTQLAKLCKAILVGHPPYEQEKTFSWLVSKKGALLYIDILFPAPLNLVLEFQGPQHFKLGRYASTEKQLREQQERDKLKAKLLKEHGYTVITWPFTRYLSRKAVYATLKEAGFEVEMPARAKPKKRITEKRPKIRRIRRVRPIIKRRLP